LHYLDFELQIGLGNEREYPVTIIRSPAGEASGTCRHDPTSDNLQATLCRLEAGDTDEALLMDLGRRLFDGLFVDGINSVFRASLGQARGRGKGLRIRLRLEPPELAALPWEYLYDPQEDRFLAISPETPLVRYVPMSGSVRPTTVSPPLRVLVVISNPSDVAPLEVEQEKEIIEAALAEWVDQGLVQLQLVERATVSEISKAMRRFRPHVFHFIGHGQYRNDRAHVMLENDDGHARPVGERDFREFFLGISEARLVVLNACQTATTSSARPLAGVSPRILQRNLSAVVAMQYPILDSSAIDFSREFYHCLASSYPVDAAIAETRKGIYLGMGSGARDWGIPILFLRAQDGQLFEVAKAEPTPSVVRQPRQLMPDLLDAHYEMVARGIITGRVIPFLGAGVNLCSRPPGIDWKYEQGNYLPSGSELATYLAENFAYPSSETQVSCPSCESEVRLAEKPQDLIRVSQYVAVMGGLGPLYDELHWIFDADYPPTSLHRFFATLPTVLRDKGLPQRGEPFRQQLVIVTTNYDDLMERAFRAEGKPFHLVSYVAEGEQRGKFLHRLPDGAVQLIEKPNEYRHLSLDQCPVILKIHGTVDRVNAEQDSYVITEDHYIEYLTHTDIVSLIPVPLSAKLKRSHLLFLGYGLRDWNLRVILHRIWGEQKLSYKSWAIQLNPQELDRRFWMERDVDILNVPLEEYIAALSGRVQALPRIGGAS
jgi:hypothetical protein